MPEITQYNAFPVVTNTIIAITGTILLTVYLILKFHITTASYKPRGCRRLGLPTTETNLADEFNPKFTTGIPESSTDEQGLPAWRVKALFTYPIKSCRGIELEAADIVPTGFEFDRLFCFAEADETDSDGKTEWVARTLRNKGYNKLALVRPDIWVVDPRVDGYNPELEEVKSQGVMVVYYPRIGRNGLHYVLLRVGMHVGLISREESFTVPLHPLVDSVPTTPVKIWKDTPLAYDYGTYIPPSFHRFITSDSGTGEAPASQDKRLTLLRMSNSHTRDIYRNAPRKETLGFQPTTGFADAYPLHILSLSSVRDVNEHCKKDIPLLSIRRFRANVIIQGPEKFEEDSWKRIRFSKSSLLSENGDEGLVLHTCTRTIRCKLPNVDPDTGHRHRNEPDRALKSHRRIDKGDLTNACLGMQGVPDSLTGRIQVDDGIEVLERGEHCYIKMLKVGEVVEGV
ncbi:MOSC domain protein [Aspergillus stella-maris]|uniref:MOSC domain protein n=1 Tax=Aspergillus stella-maris TaxID=1810926 RepID=UPI003CCD8FB3